MPLSHEQKSVLGEVITWLNKNDSSALTLGGYAGTGKTTVIAALRYILAKQRPKWRVGFAAYTGKASQVLAKKLQQLKFERPLDSVGTLHSLLYSPIADTAGQIAGWRRKDELPFDLLVIDEASMLTREIWQDVRRFGIPILAVGDHGQLPPIGESFDLMAEPDLVLTEIHRQAAESPIIQVATLARERGVIPIGNYGDGVQKLDSTESDIGVWLEEQYMRYKPDTLFLTGRNKTRVAINHSLRAALARDPQHPESGDMVMCLRNNWQLGLYNGMVGRLDSASPVNTKDGFPESYLARISDLQGVELYNGLIAAQQFGAESTFQLDKKERKRVGEQFDYGYALTVHKAQGSQARRVIVIEERSQHMDDEMWRRWLYTAVTRAEEELVVLGPPETL